MRPRTSTPVSWFLLNQDSKVQVVFAEEEASSFVNQQNTWRHWPRDSPAAQVSWPSYSKILAISSSRACTKGRVEGRDTSPGVQTQTAEAATSQPAAAGQRPLNLPTAPACRAPRAAGPPRPPSTQTRKPRQAGGQVRGTAVVDPTCCAGVRFSIDRSRKSSL